MEIPRFPLCPKTACHQGQRSGKDLRSMKDGDPTRDGLLQQLLLTVEHFSPLTSSFFFQMIAALLNYSILAFNYHNGALWDQGCQGSCSLSLSFYCTLYDYVGNRCTTTVLLFPIGISCLTTQCCLRRKPDVPHKLKKRRWGGPSWSQAKHPSHDRCCKSGHITVKEQLHCSNNELLAVGMRDITCCGISKRFSRFSICFPLRLMSEVSTSNDAQETIKLWTYLMPTQGRHKLLTHRDPAPGLWQQALNKTPLLLRLPYTLNQQSQRIAMPVRDYPQRASIPHSDLHMRDKDGIKVYLNLLF